MRIVASYRATPGPPAAPCPFPRWAPRERTSIHSVARTSGLRLRATDPATRRSERTLSRCSPAAGDRCRTVCREIIGTVGAGRLEREERRWVGVFSERPTSVHRPETDSSEHGYSPDNSNDSDDREDGNDTTSIHVPSFRRSEYKTTASSKSRLTVFQGSYVAAFRFRQEPLQRVGRKLSSLTMVLLPPGGVRGFHTSALTNTFTRRQAGLLRPTIEGDTGRSPTQNTHSHLLGSMAVPPQTTVTVASPTRTTPTWRRRLSTDTPMHCPR